MADGSSKPIEQIKLGDQVLATDPEAGASRGQDVVRTIVGDGSKNLVELTVDGQAEKIVATDGHRFWLPALNGWVRADQLPPVPELLPSNRASEGCGRVSRSIP